MSLNFSHQRSRTILASLLLRPCLRCPPLSLSVMTSPAAGEPPAPAPAPAPVAQDPTGVPASDPPARALANADPGQAAPAPDGSGGGQLGDAGSGWQGNQGTVGYGGGQPAYGGYDPDPGQGNDYGDPNQPGGFQGADVGPIILDLSGQGIALTQLTSSNQFVVGEDNYQHRTAGPGPAFRRVQTHGHPRRWHHQRRDAGSSRHHLDRPRGQQRHAQLRRRLLDRRETTFTRADGSTGTDTSVTFKQMAAGSVLETPLITQNPDGSTTVDNVTVHPDGSLATETISTTSADGLTKTLAFDDAGNGIIDRRQTDDTVVGADGSKTETVSDTNGSGVLEEAPLRQPRPTSAVSRSTATSTASGIIGQSETRQTAADAASPTP